jgi:hypothetical protein
MKKHFTVQIGGELKAYLIALAYFVAITLCSHLIVNG